MALPNVVRVRQGFDKTRLDDPCGVVSRTLQDLLDGKLAPGSRVAITAGSRGINNLEELEISEALLPQAKEVGLTVVAGARSLEFDGTGRIRPW